MKLRRELEKLKAAHALNADNSNREWACLDWQRYHDQHDAYMRREGQRPADPPTPLNHKAEVWAERMRLGFAIESLILNGLNESRVEFAPGTTDDEKREFWVFVEQVKSVGAVVANSGKLPV